MSPKDGGLISKGANEAIRVIRGLELSVLTQASGGGGVDRGATGDSVQLSISSDLVNHT